MSWDFKAGPGATHVRQIVSTESTPLLIVILHSQCPCSLATVENLTNLPEGVRSRLRLRLVFTGPQIESSDIVSGASALKHAEREYLTEAEVLQRYGAQTSGQALLYNSRGNLMFSGGLTQARGEVGESAGISAICDVMAGRKSISTAPVYGCALQTRGRVQ